MSRKDKNSTPSVTQKLQELGYNVADWDGSQSAAKITKEVVSVLSTASKSGTGKPGFPDRLYVNAREKFLVIVEEKPSVKKHRLPDKEKGAVSGVKWYLERFLSVNLPKQLKNFFACWKILGIAVSGDLSAQYQHEFNCYTLDTDAQKIVSLPQVTGFLTESQFLALFHSLDEEKAVASISSSSKKINNLLRSIDSQKRPVLLSALMICQHRVKRDDMLFRNDFPDHYRTYSAGSIITNLFETVQQVLRAEGIPQEKLAALDTELAFLKTDQTLNNSDILKDVLLELEETVIPLFNSSFTSNSNYDIIGKFYEEFLKYAGVSNVKRGIVLTPRHITTLFTKLVDLKDNDRILDLCCGTGAFLIAGMNILLEKISKSSRPDKNEAIAQVKEKQLLGFEVNSTMYICAVSNMLFRGDGKASIYNYDSIRDKRADKILKEFDATVGFINPPYSGKETDADPTPKEVTFLAKLLDHCSRYAVMIAPLSTFFKEEKVRASLLKKHTLKYVINMPSDLFQPNASTHTAIAVFETHRSFDYKKDKVVFYDLTDDGFVLSKHQGRTDVYGRWNNIEKELLNSLKPNSKPNGIKSVHTRITPNDEWTIYAHCQTDYSTLCEGEFVKSISEYMIFEALRNLGLIGEELSQIQLFEVVGNYYSDNRGATIVTKNKRTNLPIDTTKWQWFRLDKLFELKKGKRLTTFDMVQGEIPFIGSSAFRNGITAFVDVDHHIHPGNTITVAYNGSVGEAFYQPANYFACDDINVLYPQFELNRHLAMFLVTMIKHEKYRFGYGRKWHLERMGESQIKLPVDAEGQPDWQWMASYIQSLPYGDLI